jgi:hypothetical protein
MNVHEAIYRLLNTSVLSVIVIYRQKVTNQLSL